MPIIFRTTQARVLLAIIVVLSILCFKFYMDHRNSARKLSEAYAQVEELNVRLDFLSGKEMADELFIAGNHDSAIEAYKNLYASINAPSLLQTRIEQKARAEMLIGRLLEIEQGRTNESVKMEQDLRLKLGMAEEKYREMNDSIKNHLTNQISELTTNLHQKKEALEKAALVQRISFTNENGNKVKYVGEVQNGMANGNGVGLWSTGSFYEGEWKNNLKHGKGKYEWPDGEKYHGEYSLDKRNGTGTYFWKNGERYEGNWKNDRRNGFGVVYDKDNKVKLKGEWKNDELIS